LPLFRRGAPAVSALLEMCADDASVRRHGRRALVAGMVSLAGPAPGLAVAATAVAQRARRLLSPARRRSRWAHGVVASLLIAATATAPAVVAALCSH
jgi:hypothetical protein